MAVKSRAVTVAATAGGTRLDTVPSGFGEAVTSFAFYNEGAATVYMGGPDVTTANGVPVPAGAWSPGVDLQPGEAVHGIVAAATEPVRVIETGV